MTTKAPAPKISFADIFTADFWRYLFKALWLFFPGILFLVLGTLTFWTLSQGKDIMLITVEQGNNFVFLYCILAVLIWTYFTWYSSRLVGKAKGFQQPDDNHIWIRLRMQLPRLMGFSCITVVILAFLQLPGVPVRGRILLNNCWAMILLVLSIPWYFLIYVLGERFIKKDYEKDEARYLNFLRSVTIATALIIVGATVAVSILQSRWGLIVLLLGMQVGLILLLIIRRKRSEILKTSIYQQDKKNLKKKESPK